MTNPIKELLSRLGLEIDDAEVAHLGCNVEQDIVRLRTKIAEVPSKTESDETVVKFGLEHLRQAAKALVKDSRKRELELEMRLLDKPDELDLGADENKHISMHLEEEQLQAENMKREGKALLHFCDIVDRMFSDS